MSMSTFVRAAAAGAVLAACLPAPGAPRAHCDTLDGPVVAAARTALEKGDVTPALRWVRPEDEPVIRAAFGRTLAVRTLGADARDLADTAFFETLVRIHRADEGAPYTGLKPAGTDPGPAVSGADAALASGSADALVATLVEEAADGVRRRFAEALERKTHAEESLEAGRRFVQAYVEFTHFVERLHHAAVMQAAHHDTPAEDAGGEPHAHP